MSRPAVSVVMPFAGEIAGASAALAALGAIETQPGDQLIFADNSDPPLDLLRALPPAVAPDAPVEVVRAPGERSPARARNAGAERAGNDWILFLDADCHAPADLLDLYFEPAVSDDVGALAGEVAPAAAAETVAARYAASRSFLGQRAHLAHPYLPRAVAANLMVRRRAFEQLGGFLEGVRAGEDTDFSWRLQRAGWRLEPRTRARVEHVYRESLRELRRQWRGYAAGRAWLARRYDGFEPEPAIRRVARRRLRGVPRRRGRPAARMRIELRSDREPRTERARHLALDALLGIEELAGLVLSNRPPDERVTHPVQVILIAGRFPARGDPLAEFARTLDHARVEALARPAVVAAEIARELTIDYREDDGAAARCGALIRLTTRHPIRVLRAALRPRSGLLALAPAAFRLERDPGARLHPIGGEEPGLIARRLAALTGRKVTHAEAR
ncbi:MAG: glycosyltransferase [Solirubrobacterales bacterium]|nr:glycosyltransferase [Solirubrobacterales bacterium]